MAAEVPGRARAKTIDYTYLPRGITEHNTARQRKIQKGRLAKTKQLEPRKAKHLAIEDGVDTGSKS